nr:MAG TPA: Regulatory protein-modification, helix-turn-helix, transcriptional regulato, DNA [Caudoviricetes sp.]
MVNVNLLKGKFVEKGYSTAQVASGTGVNLATLYRRLNNSDEFTISEADAITRFLQLDAAEATSIFFAQFVA